MKREINDKIGLIVLAVLVGNVVLGQAIEVVADRKAIHATSDIDDAITGISNWNPGGVFLNKSKTLPDLEIKGTANNNPGDNCVIASDRFLLSSDLFLQANDAVVIQLDNDNNESGQFEIKDGTGTVILNVDEVGTAQLTGSQSVFQMNSTNSVNGSVLTLKNTIPGLFNYYGAINFAGTSSTPGQIGYRSDNSMQFRVANIDPFMTLKNGTNHIEMSNGAVLTSGGQWTDVSSASQKYLHNPIDQKQILKKIDELKIYEWSYLISPEATHIGPTAEDFYATFMYGESNLRIAAADLASTALTATQALHRENKILRREIETLKSEMRVVKAGLQKWKKENLK